MNLSIPIENSLRLWKGKENQACPQTKNEPPIRRETSIHWTKSLIDIIAVERKFSIEKVKSKTNPANQPRIYFYLLQSLLNFFMWRTPQKLSVEQSPIEGIVKVYSFLTLMAFAVDHLIAPFLNILNIKNKASISHRCKSFLETF